MSKLLYPKPQKKVKKDTSRHYYNSTIKVKPKSNSVRHEKKVKKTYQKPYRPKYPYRSIFTDDLKTCYISGVKTNIDIHHIFGGPRKTFSEKYGFIVPLSTDWHTQAPYAVHRDKKLDLELKIKCQNYWINVLNKTKEEWIDECGKWWVLNEDINL